MKNAGALVMLTALTATVALAQQASPTQPKTLAEANLIVAQARQQLLEDQVRIAELEAALASATPGLTAERQRLAADVQAAKEAVSKEQQKAMPKSGQ